MALQDDLQELVPTDQKTEGAFLRALKHLLPKGYLWGFQHGPGIVPTVYQDNPESSGEPEVQDNINAGPTIWQNNIFTTLGAQFASNTIGVLLSCFAAELVRFQDRMYALYLESIPGLSNELLTDWERITGEPDDCLVDPSSLTIAQRQIRVHNKIYGDYETQLNEQFYIDYASALGVTITVDQTTDLSEPFLVSENGTPVHAIGSRVGDRLNTSLEVATVTMTVTGGPYDANLLTELQCFFEKLKTAHIAIVWVGV